LVLLFIVFLIRSYVLPETTSLRAVDAVTDLPLAPTPEEARNIEFHYNEWDRADSVVVGDTFPTVSFRAHVRVLQRRPNVAYIELTDGSNSKGWVPDDWLASSSSSIARRQSSAATRAQSEADSFLGLTAQEVEKRLGKPIRIKRFSNDLDGDMEMLVFDETRGMETFFTIVLRDGTVCMGEYKGTRLVRPDLK
jgi:hypothetical protein